MTALKIYKVLNNNAAIIKEDGQEKIVMGPGIAFQKGKNDTIPRNKVEKIFTIHEENEKFKQILETLPEEHIEAAEEIISYAEGQLSAPLSDHIHIALVDHLSFAIERVRKGFVIQNKLLNEIKALYKKEYEIGLWAIDLVKEKLKVELPDDEAGYIALHIHTAKMDAENMQKTLKYTNIIKELIEKSNAVSIRRLTKTASHISVLSRISGMPSTGWNQMKRFMSWTMTCFISSGKSILKATDVRQGWRIT